MSIDLVKTVKPPRDFENAKIYPSYSIAAGGVVAIGDDLRLIGPDGPDKLAYMFLLWRLQLPDYLEIHGIKTYDLPMVTDGQLWWPARTRTELVAARDTIPPKSTPTSEIFWVIHNDQWYYQSLPLPPPQPIVRKWAGILISKAGFDL